MYKAFKRLCDLALALILLSSLLPLFLILGIVVSLYSNQIFFAQTRIGKDNVPFTIFKFKTMSDEVDSNGNLLPDHQRITVIGNVIRLLSLDELPQIYNILTGDMSFVGPRPLLVDYLELYTSEEIRRHNVLPGITGLAQVKGRNSLTWKEKFEFDIAYVKNFGLKQDLSILIKTFFVILKRTGINSSINNTMPKYNGNN
jgi:undecaprenyl phosphate N,N'-diacetylbacillosamine 1-phosphate transferase